MVAVLLVFAVAEISLALASFPKAIGVSSGPASSKGQGTEAGESYESFLLSSESLRLSAVGWLAAGLVTLQGRVGVVQGQYSCNCPDFVQRHAIIEAWKHIVGVRLWIAARVELEQAPKPQVFAEDAIQCAKCGSIRVIRYGRSAGKQVFKCNDCQTKFREGLVKGAKYSPEMVSLTLDLHFSGMSTRKIARAVNDQFDLHLGPSSVYRWIQRYVPMVSEYVNTLAPQTSETWHADELFVKMKGGEQEKQYGQRNMAYLWNVMDRKTRFLLASKLSQHRDDSGAIAAMLEAKKNAHSSQPERIFTDGHRSYREGISYAWFHDHKPEHIARAGIKKVPHANNNRVERLKGTLRERVKVQRGWKSMNTQIAEGMRIHYNFVKPHKALDGQTPAEAAEIGVQGDDKWFELVKKALTTELKK